MAKMTKQALTTWVASYVKEELSAGTFEATTNNLYQLTDKVGKIVALKGLFPERLEELNGDDLPYGKTIEETLIDLVMPSVYGTNGIANETNATNEGAKDLAPAYPSIEDASYSYTLGRWKTKITRPYNYIEAGVNDGEQLAELVSDINWALSSSINETRFAMKKQLLGNAISKAIDSSLSTEIEAPSDTTTGENALKQIKSDIEDASFGGENRSLGGSFIGASPELVLYVKKGIIPSLEVDTFAGAFNREDLAIPARIVVVNDFGNADEKVWGFLADPRGLKLHNSYRAIRTKENADGDFISFVAHSEETAFISKHTYMKAYISPSA